MSIFDAIESGEVYFIAEMSGNHGGSLDKALEIVRAAAEAGANCLKTQTFTPDTITLDSNAEDFLALKESLWEGRTLYDLYAEAYTPWEWMPVIKSECEALGMDFLSSVFDFSSIEYLENLGVSAYKIASPELIDLPLIRYAASMMKPMIISCGMGSKEEIGDAVQACKDVGNNQIILLKCTSEYPAVYEDMNIAVIPDMRDRFGCEVGLSDHSLGYVADVVAVSMGASVIEKHFCITREDETVDSAFSMECGEYADMVHNVTLAKQAMGTTSYELSDNEKKGLPGRRSLYATTDIKQGEIFTHENVRSVRPAHGLEPKYLDALMGKVSPRDIPFAHPIKFSDLDN